MYHLKSSLTFLFFQTQTAISICCWMGYCHFNSTNEIITFSQLSHGHNNNFCRHCVTVSHIHFSWKVCEYICFCTGIQSNGGIILSRQNLRFPGNYKFLHLAQYPATFRLFTWHSRHDDSRGRKQGGKDSMAQSGEIRNINY